MNDVSNPIQACNDIFMRPNAVFKALSERDNWSWVPFFITIIALTLPSYLYFGVVDFDWYQTTTITAQMPDASPAEIDNAKAMSSQGLTQKIALFGGMLGLLLINCITALYFTLMTRNDEKSVHSFTDWYGAQWWFMLPFVIGALIACAIIMLAEPGAQLSQATLSPLSLAFIFGVEMNSDWFGLMQSLRLETIWSIYLASVCLSQWTNFSGQKAIIVAAMPSVIVLTITALFAIF